MSRMTPGVVTKRDRTTRERRKPTGFPPWQAKGENWILGVCKKKTGFWEFARKYRYVEIRKFWVHST